MSATLAAFCDQGIHTHTLHTLCESNTTDNRDNLCANCLPVSHIFLRASGSGCDYINLLFHQHLCDIVHIRIHQHQVYTKWLIGQSTALLDLLTDTLCVKSAGCDQSQSTGIAHSRSKTPTAAPHHTTLNNRIPNTQKRSNSIHNLIFILLTLCPNFYFIIMLLINTVASIIDLIQIYQNSRYAPPHVRPPPNPTQISFMPGLIMPFWFISESAIGILAELVFPYSSRLI